MSYPPPPIGEFDGLVAVVTGGGSGIGRELVRQLVASGCTVATCDVAADGLDETSRVALDGAPDGVRVSTFVADVSDADAMRAFADHVAADLDIEAIDLLFNNAGVSGGASVVVDPPDAWDRVFAICFGGVLNGVRAFLPMLRRTERGHVVNTSSINGMWAFIGPGSPHTAYSTAKFAVRGLTEALITDFRVNAPHLTVSVVMPGHIGTGIMRNSMLLAGIDVKDMSDDAVAQVRQRIEDRGIDVSGASDEDIRNLTRLQADSFEADAPTTAAEAATIILDGVRAGDWRVLVGPDAVALDVLLRERPLDAYTDEFVAALQAQGHFGNVTS